MTLRRLWIRLTAFLLPTMFVVGVQPAAAQFDISGHWGGVLHEDFPERIPGPALGDFLGLPINDFGRKFAEAWDPSRLTVPEHQCRAHSAPYINRGPLNLRLWEERDPFTQELVALHHYVPKLPAAPRDLDGRSDAPVGVRAAHLDRIFDRAMGWACPRRHDDPHQADVAPAQRDFPRAIRPCSPRGSSGTAIT